MSNFCYFQYLGICLNYNSFTISLFSDELLYKINIYFWKIFTIERRCRIQWRYTPTNNTHYTVHVFVKSSPGFPNQVLKFILNNDKNCRIAKICKTEYRNLISVLEIIKYWNSYTAINYSWTILKKLNIEHFEWSGWIYTSIIFKHLYIS